MIPDAVFSSGISGNTASLCPDMGKTAHFFQDQHVLRQSRELRFYSYISGYLMHIFCIVSTPVQKQTRRMHAIVQMALATKMNKMLISSLQQPLQSSSSHTPDPLVCP